MVAGAFRAGWRAETFALMACSVRTFSFAIRRWLLSGEIHFLQSRLVTPTSTRSVRFVTKFYESTSAAGGQWCLYCALCDCGQPGRLVVDTGAFLTTFNEPALKLRGIALQPTRETARFTNGVARQMTIGQINNFTIGDFKVPPSKFSAAVLPGFALEQGNTRIDGILGMDLLFNSHSIIDFDSMSLFLK